MVQTPTDVTCDAMLNTTAKKVTGKCDWKYTGDLSLVAYFNVQISLDDKEINVLAPSDANEVVFAFQSSNQSANYSVAIYAIDYCNTQSPSQIFMGNVAIKQGSSYYK